MKKILFLYISLILFSFTTADVRSGYKVPREAASVCSADIDLDGDNDIVVGHMFNPQNNWTGISILINNRLIPMELDSFYLNGQHRSVIIQKLDNNSFPDLISQSWDGTNSQIHIVFNLNTSMSNIYNINIESYADNIETGDLNNDATNDIVFISNNNQYWGIIYNKGNEDFSQPEYHNLDYYPQNIVSADLNNDGRDDIVIGGKTEIYYSTETGFQNRHLDESTSRVLVTDIDNDGDIDIIGLLDLFGTDTDITLFENKGSEAFEKIEMAHPSFGSIFSLTADFNNDTLPDLMVLPPSNNGVYIFYNTGSYSFGHPKFIDIPNEGEAYRRATVADLDNNGYNDIVIVRRTGPHASTYNNVIILFNDGNGHFVENPIGITEHNNNDLISEFTGYPNPYITYITFEFTIRRNSRVELSVYNLQGKLIKKLINKKMKGGKHKIKWDGLNNASQTCKPGPYFAYLKVNGFSIRSFKLIKY